MGLLDMFSDAGWQPDASKGMLGLLSPSDRFMAAMQAISHMGAQMAQPGQSRGQALASGAAGFGQGLQSGMQSALMQQMMGLKLKDAQQQAEWKRTLADAFGGSAVPSAPMAAAPGQPVAQDMADRMNGQRAATLNDPKVQGAIMGLYGPTGLAALRAEDKAAETKETFDEQGRKAVRQWNPATKRYDISVGAAQIDATKPIFNPTTGKYEFAPGVVEANAGMKGAETGAAQKAELEFAGPRARAVAAATQPFELEKIWASPRREGPGERIIAGGSGPNDPVRVISSSPNPAPGTQEGKYGQGIGELQSKTVEGWRSGAEAGFVTLQNVDRMKQAVDNGLKTGTLAPVKEVAVNALASFGVDQDQLNKFFNAKDSRTFDAAAKELVLPVVKSLGANPTDADRKFIEATIPQLRDNPQAVKSLLDWMEQRAQSKIDLYQQGYEHASKGGDPLKFEQDWWKKNGRPQKQSAGNGGWSVTPVP